MRAALLLAAAVPPLSHESMWLMKRVGAPAASPDGSGWSDGRKETFKTNRLMDEVVYKTIADRIVARAQQ